MTLHDELDCTHSILETVDIEFIEDAKFHGAVGMGTLFVIPVEVKKGQVWKKVEVTKDTFVASSKNFNGKTAFKKDIELKNWIEYKGSNLPDSNCGSCSIPINIFKITKRYSS